VFSLLPAFGFLICFKPYSRRLDPILNYCRESLSSDPPSFSEFFSPFPPLFPCGLKKVLCFCFFCPPFFCVRSLSSVASLQFLFFFLFWHIFTIFFLLLFWYISISRDTFSVSLSSIVFEYRGPPPEDCRRGSFPGVFDF